MKETEEHFTNNYMILDLLQVGTSSPHESHSIPNDLTNTIPQPPFEIAITKKILAGSASENTRLSDICETNRVAETNCKYLILFLFLYYMLSIIIEFDNINMRI